MTGRAAVRAARPFARARARALGLLFAAFAVLAPVAEAETELWSTTMTAGTDDFETGYRSGEFGSLAADELTIDGTTFTVERLHADTGASVLLSVSSEGVLTDLPDDGSLTLKLENADAPGTWWEFSFADQEHDDDPGEYWHYGEFDDPLPSGHASGDTLAVKLVSSRAPTLRSIAPG